MTRALALFSGGLDSILACRVLMAQGIDVVVLRFITPFFTADVGVPWCFCLCLPDEVQPPLTGPLDQRDNLP